jgi:uncharacterized protein (TIGR02001 family)
VTGRRVVRPAVRTATPLAAALALALCCPSACAQWSGVVSLQSDYRYRGLSRSDEQPSMRATLSFDAPGGWYGGASAATVELDPGERGAELLLYAGRAWRLDGALSWDLGATATRFTAARYYDYGEVHAGLIGPGWNVRLHVARDYYGGGTDTAYAEVNAWRPLADRWRLFGHAGVLARTGGAADDGRRARADVRVGVAATLDRYELALSWVAVQREGVPSYAAAPAHSRSVVVLAASAAF